MKNENNKFMPFLIILPLVLMKLTLMIMKKNILKYKNNNTNLFSKKKEK
jgi:hypothetical protein